jgi:Ca2+/Na+ antiporter
MWINSVNVSHSLEPAVYFMAPSDEVFNAVVDRLEALWKHWESEAPQLSTAEETADNEFDNSDPHVDLTEFPTDASVFRFYWFLFSYPLRFIMQWTIGDVRTMDKEGNPTSTLGKAYCAIFMCLVWLVVGSYAMVASLERLAALMDIPDAVIGVTVSAAGTSLPNYVASKVAAQKGFGVSYL